MGVALVHRLVRVPDQMLGDVVAGSRVHHDTGGLIAWHDGPHA
jgi:hypothetical protein